jgi:hypothetical protein
MKYKKEILLVIAVIVVAFVLFSPSSPVSVGSIAPGDAYQATTTSTGRFASGITNLCSVGGAVGSVVVTGAAAGQINLYNATTSATSGTTGRAASVSTSSIWAINIPVSAAAGTYVFDEIFDTGIVLEVLGTIPTTTITYRCNN